MVFKGFFTIDKTESGLALQAYCRLQYCIMREMEWIAHIHSPSFRYKPPWSTTSFFLDFFVEILNESEENVVSNKKYFLV